jgi:hypothetical protein
MHTNWKVDEKQEDPGQDGQKIQKNGNHKGSQLA